MFLYSFIFVFSKVHDTSKCNDISFGSGVRSDTVTIVQYSLCTLLHFCMAKIDAILTQWGRIKEHSHKVKTIVFPAGTFTHSVLKRTKYATN